MDINVSYGQGQYIEGQRSFKGQIILGAHKLYLKGPDGDLPQTYIALEKIEKIKKTSYGIEIKIRPSSAMDYSALIKGERYNISQLVTELVGNLNLKKRFLKSEWVGEVSWGG